MESDVERYFVLREIQGISRKWLDWNKLCLRRFLDFVDWRVDENKTLEYIRKLKEKASVAYYRKRVYQIRKFLIYLGVKWADDIKLPPEPLYQPKRVTREEIIEILHYFKNHRFFEQIKAVVLLGATSGIRAEELYQLNPSDIDVENRTVYIIHDEVGGKTTKTKRSRVSFFNEETQKALSDYLGYFGRDNTLKTLFSKTHIGRQFREAPLKVKDLRKFFSQEWDRLGGPTSIKKILMGHSLRNDVDLMHYNCQSPDDLKRVYDRVGIKIF